MYEVDRGWFKYGNEEDEVEITIKHYETFKKALAYGKRYAKGTKFAYYTIFDDEGNMLYEQLANGVITDNRKKETEKEELEM